MSCLMNALKEFLNLLSLLNRNKCELSKTSIKFLGQMCDENGVKPVSMLFNK